MEDERRTERRRREDRRNAARELVGSGLITELADDVRLLIVSIDELRDEVRRRASRLRAQRIRIIVGFLAGLVLAVQLSAVRVDMCLLDVHYALRPTELCDAMFPVVTHGNLRDLPAWPTPWNVAGLAAYLAAAVAGWVTLRRASGQASWEEPDETFDRQPPSRPDSRPDDALQNDVGDRT